MAGRKKRKLDELTEVDRDKSTESTDNENDSDEQQGWLALLKDPLELIMSQLTLRENIIASLVCKKWLDAAKSVRPLKKAPWLMFFPKNGDLFEFLDPFSCEFYTLELPELRDSRVCHSKDGWLLVYTPKSEQLKFFKPYTKELIELPKIKLTHQAVAFSAAPTSNSCIVFTISHVSTILIAVTTCHPGATEWDTVNYTIRLPFLCSSWNKMVFSAGKFYCLSLTGWLGVYDTETYNWSIHLLAPPKCPDKHCLGRWWKTKFLAEHNGELFAIFTSGEVNPVIYKLDQATKDWEEVKTIGGLTIFAGYLVSHAMTDLHGTMANSVYFPKVRLFGKRCISYSLSDNRYYPKKQYYDWGQEDPLGSIWIEPPEDQIFKALFGKDS